MANPRPVLVTPKSKKRISCSTSTGSTPVRIASCSGEVQVIIRSLSTNAVDAYLAFGNSSVTCDPTLDDGFAPGAKEGQTVIAAGGELWVAGITESGTATMEIMFGTGW